MTLDRSEELIPAGIAPSKVSSTQNPFERVHRGTAFILGVDTVILVIFFSSLLETFLLSTSAANLAPLAVILPAIGGGLIWSGYRRKQKWAYWPSAIIIGLAALFFGLLALNDVLQFLSGSSISFLMALLLGWATFGSIRRVRFHFHQGYRAAYLSQSENDPNEIELEEGEMFAACSTCLAVLAIRPDLLSPDDRCPHCDNKLVSQQTAAKYQQDGEEE